MIVTLRISKKQAEAYLYCHGDHLRSYSCFGCPGGKKSQCQMPAWHKWKEKLLTVACKRVLKEAGK